MFSLRNFSIHRTEIAQWNAVKCTPPLPSSWVDGKDFLVCSWKREAWMSACNTERVCHTHTPAIKNCWHVSLRGLCARATKGSFTAYQREYSPFQRGVGVGKSAHEGVMLLAVPILFYIYSRLCPSTAASSPLPESSNFLCPLLFLSIPLPVAPQCHLSNDVLVFRLILSPLSASLCF